MISVGNTKRTNHPHRHELETDGVIKAAFDTFTVSDASYSNSASFLSVSLQKLDDDGGNTVNKIKRY